MILRMIVVAVLSVLMTACATQQTYDWNQYDQRLYNYYKNPTTADEFITAMDQHVRGLEAKGQKPPPGLYAELGTFYLKRGDPKLAIQYYNKETVAWPESKSLMSALIASVDKQRLGEVK